MLVQTSTGQWLNPDAAASFELMSAEFRLVFGKPLWINSGSRAHAEQDRTFRQNYNPFYTVAEYGRVERKWFEGKWWYRKAFYPITAVPGTSTHEDPPGRAADFGSNVNIQGSAEHNWMLANAWRWGWQWTGEWYREPWHWEKTGPVVAGGGASPIPTPPKPKPIYNLEEDDMLMFRIGDKGDFYVVGINDGEAVTKAEASAIARAASGTGKAEYKDGTDVFRRIPLAQAKLIIEGAKRRRTRMYKAIAALSDKSLDNEFAGLNDDLDRILDRINEIAKETGETVVDVEGDLPDDYTPPERVPLPLPPTP